MKPRVLVFPCGSEIGLEIHNSLKWSTQIEVWGASSRPDHGKFVYKNYIEGVPFVDTKNFIPGIKRVIKRYKIDYVFPAHDSVVLKLAQNLKTLGCKVIGSPPETCEICRSKKKTYRTFSQIIRTPKMYTKNDKKILFPVFLKPEIGQGSKGVYLANSKKELGFYLKKDPTLLMLEYLPGKEYTIDCFTDKSGKLRFVGARQRVRIVNGISANTHPTKNRELEGVAGKINKRLTFRGVWFFQVKEASDGELALTEIAPRVAGTMGLYRNLGVNFALLSVFDAMDENVEIISNKYYAELDRAFIPRYKVDLSYKHVYIDLDDTIIFKGKVNQLILSFIFQCINQKKRVHLLTKYRSAHKKNVELTLTKYRLLQLFDEIIDVPAKSEKYLYIKNKDSIFIDDSFSERKKVHDNLGIPTFDTNSVESLIDYKY